MAIRKVKRKIASGKQKPRRVNRQPESVQQSESLDLKSSGTDCLGAEKTVTKKRRVGPGAASVSSVQTVGGRCANISAEDMVVDETKYALAKRAVEDIHAMIAMHKGAARACLHDWCKTYKAVLGGYKRFVLSRQSDFSVVDVDSDGNFLVTAAGEKPPDGFVAGRGTRCWQKHAAMAWRKYCEVTPDVARSLESSFLTILKAAEVATASTAVVTKEDNEAAEVPTASAAVVQKTSILQTSLDVEVGSDTGPAVTSAVTVRRKRPPASVRQRAAKRAHTLQNV